jgi:hypothetical protein
MARLAILVCLLLPVAWVSTAQDVTGKWSGSFKTLRPDGVTDDDDKIFLDLKQSGSELAGTAGPTAEKQWPLKGKIEGSKLTFEAQTDAPLIKFTLTLVDGHLVGDAVAEHEGRKLAAKIDAVRVKQ